ncbi:DUF5989 family protein [Rhodopirellula sp. MGV]|uniref:DUF5989 family protein n=1 Tax=Rhodopirellula sp. MGV TaxID=2023130 RepID=UPI000B95F335|nr:DUF5989 family protein [Rhodopirellula sp. MGV]OYP29495.1 hypothetical protein CGZ80_24375 [Rhodopirellula sp. MGV]PNY33798.1 hypothetical protein C2E31_27310 [Rhodopirellula baltica]
MIHNGEGPEHSEHSHREEAIEGGTVDRGGPERRLPDLNGPSEFERQAGATEPGLLREFVWFLRYNKKWWLLPIVGVLLLLVALAFVTTSPAAPFIYTLF